MAERIFKHTFDELIPCLRMGNLHRDLFEQTDKEMVDQRIIDEHRLEFAAHRQQRIEVLAHLDCFAGQQILRVAQRVAFGRLE